MFPVEQMSGAENVHIVTTCEMSGSILCTTYAPIVGGIAAPNVRITLPLVLSGSPLPKRRTAQGRDPVIGQPLAAPTPANNLVESLIPLGGPDFFLVAAGPLQNHPKTGAVIETVFVSNSRQA